MMQYSQQQCNKDHSALNSLTVLHFPPVPQTALYIISALVLQTNKTSIKYQLSSYFIVNAPTMSLLFLALSILKYSCMC